MPYIHLTLTRKRNINKILQLPGTVKNHFKKKSNKAFLYN